MLVTRAAIASSTLRSLLGVTALVVPRLPLRAWIGDDADRPTTHVLARGLGARDIALGIGALHALRAGGNSDAWLRAAAFNDAVDAAATALAFKQLPHPGRVMVLLAASGGAVLSALSAAAGTKTTSG